MQTKTKPISFYSLTCEFVGSSLPINIYSLDLLEYQDRFYISLEHFKLISHQKTTLFDIDATNLHLWVDLRGMGQTVEFKGVSFISLDFALFLVPRLYIPCLVAEAVKKLLKVLINTYGNKKAFNYLVTESLNLFLCV